MPSHLPFTPCVHTVCSQRTKRFFARVYPAALRYTSTNLDPLPLWAVGTHMVALGDRDDCNVFHHMCPFSCSAGTSGSSMGSQCVMLSKPVVCSSA